MIRKLMAGSAVAVLLSAAPMTFAAVQDQAAAAATSPDEPSGKLPATTAPLQAEHPTLVSAFIGKSVYVGESADADNIGEVNDLIVSSDGSITHAIIGVGGFLGIGQKDVAVPFDDLQVVEVDRDIRLIYAATREQLEQAPPFDRSAYEPGGRPAGSSTTAEPAPAAAPAQSAPAPAAAAGAPISPAPGDASASAPDAPASSSATAQVAENAAAGAPAASTVNGFVSFSSGDQIRASTMLGKKIYGPDNSSIGEVGDLILQDDGKTRAAVIDVGGFLGIGQKQVAIPFGQIQMTTQDNQPRLAVAMTKDQLGQAPAYVRAGESSNVGASTDPAPAAGSQPAGDQVAQQQFTAASQDISAQRLIGRKVVSTSNENLGRVGDVVFDREGNIQAVVVDVGGFLGIGQKSVALTFDQLNVQKDKDGDLQLRVNATQEQLQNAPAYTPANSG